MTGVTEAYERQLWEELNALFAAVVPEGASPEEARRVVLLAVMGCDHELHELYEQVRRLARTKAGYLRERLEEDNRVSAIRQWLRFPAGAGRQA